MEHNQRRYGRSNYRLSKIIELTWDLFVNFSIVPLKMLSGFGFILSSISVVWALVLVFLKILYEDTTRELEVLKYAQSEKVNGICTTGTDVALKSPSREDSTFGTA